VRLVSFEAVPFALPFKRPYATARGTLTQREMILLRLRTDNDLVGLGEAVPLSLRGGATLGQVVRELGEVDESEMLHDLIERGIPDNLEPKMIDPRLVLSRPTQCAVLGAIADLLKKLFAAESVFDLPPPPPIRCNATLVSGPPEAVAADAIEWAEEGFDTFKLKLGGDDDVAQVRAVREAVGPRAKIRVDANGVWSPEQAAEIVADIEPYGIELVEQPVATIEEAAELARLTSIPLAGDESIATVEEAEHAAELGAFALTGIKLSKVGGFSAGLEIAERLPAYASSALDGPVGIAEGASFAAALDEDHQALGEPEQVHGLATQRLFASSIASVECEIRDGWLHPPQGPGLGVEIDEEALQAHRL
jgi:L-alanine-DL-glutamate epimerase-like enolase superfamily enzyme